MRNRLLVLLGACSIVGLAAPASAALVGVSNVNLADQPFTFGFSGGNFTFSYEPIGTFDVDPIVLQTSGTAATTSFGGFLGIPLTPSTFFTRANVTIGPDTFPGFASFETPTAIPFSLVEGDLGLRVTVGDDDFFGYARLGGSVIQSIAFETTANTPITAGSFVVAAVPEPATWAMMTGGIGLLGGLARRRRATTVRTTYA